MVTGMCPGRWRYLRISIPAGQIDGPARGLSTPKALISIPAGQIDGRCHIDVYDAVPGFQYQQVKLMGVQVPGLLVCCAYFNTSRSNWWKNWLCTLPGWATHFNTSRSNWWRLCAAVLRDVVWFQYQQVKLMGADHRAHDRRPLLISIPAGQIDGWSVRVREYEGDSFQYQQVKLMGREKRGDSTPLRRFQYQQVKLMAISDLQPNAGQIHFNTSRSNWWAHEPL